MINANELRIGNWFNLMGENCKLCAINEEFILRSTAPRINPILLTAEILEKAGFKTLTDSWYEIDLFEGARKLSISLGEGWAIGDEDYVREVVFKAVDLHLHTLQNLYFALTGQELEITF